MSNLRYSIYVARIGDILLRQIDSVSVRTQQTKTEVVLGGAVDRSAIITAIAEPTLDFRTGDLDTLLASEAKIDIQTGYRVDTVNVTTTAATLVQYQQRVDGGVFSASTTAHYQITSTKGFAAIEEIVAEQDSKEGAKAHVTYWALSTDGLVAPLSIAQTTSGLTSTPLFGGQFYLGPILFGAIGSGVKMTGVKRIRVRPGIEYRVKRSDGSVYGDIGSIHTRKPEIAFQVENVDEFYTRLTAFFGAGVPSNTAFYLQKGASNSTRVAYATTSHIRFVATTGEWSPDTIEVQESDDAGIEIIFRPLTLSVTCGVAIA